MGYFELYVLIVTILFMGASMFMSEANVCKIIYSFLVFLIISICGAIYVVR